MAHSMGLSQLLKASSFTASPEIPQILWILCSQDNSTGPVVSVGCWVSQGNLIIHL